MEHPSLSMKAAVFERYGLPERLRIVDQPKPLPRAGEILIRVRATTVTNADCGMRRGEPRWGRLLLGFLRPRKSFRVLGLEISGEVVGLGAGVSSFRLNEEVFGFTGFRLGGHAQFCCLPQSASLAAKPTNLTWAEAAGAVDGSTTAYYFLKQLAQLRAGQRVLINGASGSIGSYAVQLAAHWGAEVTAVCGPQNTAFVKGLGASRVIDYTQEDFTKSDNRYDIVFDAVGKSSFRRCRPVLSPLGCYLSTTGLVNYPLMWWTGLFGRKTVRTGMSVEKRESLASIQSLLVRGLLRVHVDRSYAFEQIAEAHRYVEAGHKKGNVVVLVD